MKFLNFLIRAAVIYFIGLMWIYEAKACGTDENDLTEIRLIIEYVPCPGGWCRRR